MGSKPDVFSLFHLKLFVLWGCTPQYLFVSKEFIAFVRIFFLWLLGPQIIGVWPIVFNNSEWCNILTNDVKLCPFLPPSFLSPSLSSSFLSDVRIVIWLLNSFLHPDSSHLKHLWCQCGAFCAQSLWLKAYHQQFTWGLLKYLYVVEAPA